MRQLAVAPVLAALTLLSGCVLNPPRPFPLSGPAPHTVLLLPAAGAVEDEASHSLLAALETALRARGYYPIPAEVGLAMLRPRGLAEHRVLPAEDYARVARELGADAFMTMNVGRWDARWVPDLVHLEYDIGYRLWGAEDGALLWELRSPGAWDLDDEPRGSDIDAAMEAYVNPAQWGRRASPFHDNLDVALALQRRAMASLPLGPLH